MWGGKLTEDQRNRWCAAGANVMSHPRLGQKGPLTGQQFWQAINSVRGCVGLPTTFEPPARVTFGPSVVGPLTITNDETGVRLWLPVSGELTEDVMVFGQEPCPSGRSKRRNVAYLGLLSAPIDGKCEITRLYTARYGEPRPGRKVFIVTCQQKDGWKGFDQVTNAIVPSPPAPQPALAETSATTATSLPPAAPTGLPALTSQADSQNPYMYKGRTTAAQRKGWPPDSHLPAINKPDERPPDATGTGAPDGGGGNPGLGSPG